MGLFEKSRTDPVHPLPVAPTANSTLVWDAENRMISSTVSGITTSQQFDAMGRRISKTTGTSSIIYLYDSWNCIAEYTRNAGVSPVLKTARLWGIDPSGTFQGAGGVGGLLSESSLINSNQVTFNSYYPTYDGNGNVSEYLTTGGTVAAHLEYDPFGNTVVNTDVSIQFTYKFSTKSQDGETGLYYYGYRYYDPLTGRWPNRDPIQEKGGVNLYGMVGNNAVDKLDVLGKQSWQLPPGFHIGSNGDWNYSPPVKTITETEVANQQFDYLAAKFINGSDVVSFEFGGSMPWTKVLMRKPVYDRMRIEIRKLGLAIISGEGDKASGKWDDNADDYGLKQPIIDLMGYAGLSGELKSLGSYDGYFYITSTDRKKCTVTYRMAVETEYRVGSLTRAGRGTSGIIKDNPNGSINARFNTINVRWKWEETLNLK